jgi:hypothetical protein
MIVSGRTIVRPYREAPPWAVKRLAWARLRLGADPRPRAPLPCEPPVGMSAIIYARLVAEVRDIERGVW